MRSYKPSTPFNVPMTVLIPSYDESYGVEAKTFSEGRNFFGSFRTFGGTDTTVNGLYSVENTAVIETWYGSDIQSNCRIRVGSKDFEILGEPENIQMRNQYLKIKVKEVKGGA